MPEHSVRPLSQFKLAPLWRAARQRRWPIYAAGGVMAVLVIAWFDGGEEPLRPIVQPVALPAGTAR
jgi:hypothetical protein